MSFCAWSTRQKLRLKVSERTEPLISYESVFYEERHLQAYRIQPGIRPH